MRHLLKSKCYVPYLILLGVIIIPLLYSYFYLGAFWDPYSSLDTVPVAVVNEDTGATINDKSRNLGQEMCDELKKDASLKFTFTDADTATAGLEGHDYYAVLTIPSNFSSNIATASDVNKQTATISYKTNEKRNYLAAQILKSAVGQIESSIHSSVNEEIVTTLSNKLNDVPSQLTDLNNGLTDLKDGASTLTNGTADLLAGANDLNSGTSTLANGTASLATGAASFVHGTSSLVTGTSSLVSGTSSLATGASSLLAGTNKLQSGASSLLDGSKTLASGLTSYQSAFKTFNASLKTASDGSKSFTNNMSSLTKGINDLLIGATQLEAGTSNLSKLQSGASTLATGAATLEAGITSYTDGVDTLLSTLTQTTQVLATYAAQTNDPTITAIVTNLTSKENQAYLQQLSTASTTLKAGAAQIKEGSNSLAKGTTDLDALKAGITSLKDGLTMAKTGSVALSEGANKLNVGMNQLVTAGNELQAASGDLTTGASSLKAGIDTLTAGITSVNDGASSLASGADQVNAGASSLKEGADQLNSGASSLASGINKVNDGASSLKAGTESLVSGTTTLDDGANQLKNGITTAKDGVSTSITDANEQISKLDGLSDYAAEPVTMDSSAYDPVPNYGTAFAPYFMSLSLWVGGLMIFFGIYFDPDQRFELLSRRNNHIFKRCVAYFAIGIIQSILLCIVLIAGLGLKVTNIPLYFASTCLVSLVFIAIIQLLLLFFSNIGKFLAIALLILQLTSCGGTFPMETVPKFFNVLYPFMPMTYSVGLFKEAISGSGDTSAILYNSVILLAILLVIMFITLLFGRPKKAELLQKHEV